MIDFFALIQRRLFLLSLFVSALVCLYPAPSSLASAEGELSAEPGLRIVTSTGRAAISHEDAMAEARSLALEDALYFAALKGGAKIDGFSAVDAQTNLSDMFVVRPASTILDYDIINEIQDDIHYEVTVRAIVGEVNDSGCQNRPVSHLTLFKPHLKLAYDAPNWMSQMPAFMAKNLAVSLSNQSQLRVRDARTISAGDAQYGKANMFDYATLTSGRTAMQNGDLGLVSQISVKMDSGGQMFLKTSYAHIHIISDFVDSAGQMLQDPIIDEFKIKLGEHHLLRSMTVMNQEHRDIIRQLASEAMEIHAQKITSKLICMPLRDRLMLTDKGLSVALGTAQGLTPNHLGYVRTSQSPMTFLKVEIAQDRNAALVPLNSALNLAELDGAEVTFLEFSQ